MYRLIHSTRDNKTFANANKTDPGHDKYLAIVTV